jgi:hypothetical protein
MYGLFAILVPCHYLSATGGTVSNIGSAPACRGLISRFKLSTYHPHKQQNPQMAALYNLQSEKSTIKIKIFRLADNV